MTDYARMYRLGFTPWERYGRVSASTFEEMFDREERERGVRGPDGRRLGRALDLGCGRGRFTAELARRGWDAVGVDLVPAAIEAAERDQSSSGARFVVADVTRLGEVDLGTFDLFLDVGCFQGLDGSQRRDLADGVTAMAAPGATLLILAFGPSRYRRFVEGASQEEVERAFDGWRLLSVDPAPTQGLGWPMNRTAPQWYRLRAGEAAAAR
ncbi:class I SAM-dependent methyltransferase [Salana multivorans]